jgi:phosphatidylglycerophosphate synthase
VDRFLFLAPALLLLAGLFLAFFVYCARCAVGRPPAIENIKHNQLLGLFFARFLVWLIGPLERLLIGRVSPNMITAVSLLLCGITGMAAARGHLAGAVCLYAFAGALDVLDGRLARMTNQQTPAGALFDSVSDRWGELFVLTGYVWYLRESSWMLGAMAAIGGSMMVSYTRARSEGLGVSLSSGLMQRAERIVLVTGGTLLAAWYGNSPDTVWLVPPILGLTLLICGVASTGTALSRWVMAYRELARRSEESARHEAIASLTHPSAPPPARVLIPPHVRKVAPIEQH